ncbi:MAG: anthranilate phosphoribosyltransferase [Flavobacteriales bacterium]
MKKILNRLFDHEKLTRDEAREVLSKIAAEEYNDAQVAAFITVFLMRTVSKDELNGFRDALLDRCLKVDLGGVESIDLCGTGGDGKNTFNVSTLSSFVVAGAGYKVTKHGNYGVSSVCGSSNVLEALGYNFTNDVDTLKRQLDNSNITFLHAPLFHPAMKSVAPVRRNLGVKTFFNMLGPIVNPARPTHQISGVFSLKLLRIYNFILQEANVHYKVLHALDGYDEVSLTGDFKMASNEGEEVLSPSDLALPRVNPSDIFGGDTIEEAKGLFEKIISGEGTTEQISVVAANAGLAIHTFSPKMELEKCVEKAKESLQSGKAHQALKNLLSV